MEPKILYAVVDTEADGKRVVAPVAGVLQGDGTAKISIDGGGGGGAVTSVNGKTGIVVLDKTDVGLTNVDNTADTAKPVSTAQAAADTAVLASANATTAAHASAAAPHTGHAATGAVGSSGITMSTARLLGRSTASTGPVEEITLGTNLSFSGQTLNASSVSPGGSSGNLQANNGSGGFTGVTSSSVSGADVTFGGSLTSTLGTFISGVANGASAIGFNFNTPSYTTSGALLRRTQNNGTIRETLTKAGALILYPEHAVHDGTTAPIISISGAPHGIAYLQNQYTGFGGDDGGGWTMKFVIRKYSNIAVPGGYVFTWTSSALNANSGGYDTGLGRNAAGVVEVNNGTAGTFRNLKLRSLISSGGVITLSSYTVATLPAAASNTHAIVAVTDSNATITAGIGAVVAGGGSNNVPVYSNGTDWRII